MRIPRIYHPETIHQLGELSLSEDAAGHIGRVLRMKEGDRLTLFNGLGGEYGAVIEAIAKKQLTININNQLTENKQSPLEIHLGIAMSKGDRMDWVMQKSTEIGIVHTPIHVNQIYVKEMFVACVASPYQRTVVKDSISCGIYKFIYLSPCSKLTLFLYGTCIVCDC